MIVTYDRQNIFIIQATDVMIFALTAFFVISFDLLACVQRTFDQMKCLQETHLLYIMPYEEYDFVHSKSF